MNRRKVIRIEVILTRHALMRIKQRLGLRKAGAEKIAVKAYVSGLHYKQTKGSFNQYLNSLNEQGPANNIRVYGESIFLFHHNELITVLHVPNEFKKYLTIKGKSVEQ